MLNWLLVFNLIFISLNLCAAVETKVKAEQQFLEINPKNLKYLQDTFYQQGFNISALQSLVLDYLIEYKYIKSLNYSSHNVRISLPEDNFAIAHDKKIEIKDWDSNILQLLEGHEDNVKNICFLEYNLLASSCNGEIKIWDIKTGKCLQTINSLTDDSKIFLYYLGDNKLVTFYMPSTIVEIFDITTGEVFQGLECNNQPVVLSLLKNNEEENNSDKSIQVAIATIDGTIQIWDIITGNRLQCFKNSAERVQDLCALQDNKLACTSGQNIEIFDCNTGEIFKVLNINDSFWVGSLCLLTNGLLVALYNDRKVRIWDVNSGKYIQELKGSMARTNLLSLSKGKFAVWKSYRSRIDLIDIYSQKFDLIEK